MSDLSEKLKSFGKKSLNHFDFSAKEDLNIIREDTKTVMSEDVDTGISRLRVQISKLKNKLENDPGNVRLNAMLASVYTRKKNLEAAARIRDVWAKNAEASHNPTED